MESPCKTCRSVEDPTQCENKLCRRWQKWFVSSWNSACRSLRQTPPNVSPCQKCPLRSAQCPQTVSEAAL